VGVRGTLYVVAAFIPLLNGIRPPGNSFVLPRHKMVYISVTKVACTSLRWMIADLGGEDFERFYRSSAPHQSRLMTVHADRASWRHVPQLKNVQPDVLGEISRDNGWFIFAMVRDPWSRLWSAWQSKFLVRHSSYVDQYGTQAWFPRVPEQPSDVIEDWAAFIAARPWRTNPELAKDVHFQPQVRSVRPQQINYTRIYDLSRMSELINDIQAHLESIDMSHRLYLPRANENPLPLTAEVLDNGVRESIERAYRADFNAFPDRWNFADLKFAEDGWTPDAIRAAAFHTVANERIGDLSRELRESRRRVARRLTARAARTLRGRSQ
jgi:hypothetical protein